MNLLDITRGPANGWATFPLELFVGKPLPCAIPSHRWGPSSDEVTFKDLQGDQVAAGRKAGYARLEGCCTQAVRRGFSYAWVDMCCIDKSSSAELSEAIDSMFAWYRGASVRFTHLVDVPARRVGSDGHSQDRDLALSEWFSRG